MVSFRSELASSQVTIVWSLSACDASVTASQKAGGSLTSSIQAMWLFGLAGTLPNCLEPDSLCEPGPPDASVDEVLYFALKRM